jgi:hypothetical protein
MKPTSEDAVETLGGSLSWQTCSSSVRAVSVDAAVQLLILDERNDDAASTTSFDFVYVDPKDAGQQLQLVGAMRPSSA